MVTENIHEFEQHLCSFNPIERKSALIKLKSHLNSDKKEQQNVNMHFHSFHSYNAKFWSPSRIAWEAKKNELFVAGIIDFDVLSGLEEFLEAGELLNLRTTVGIETRAFLNEYADKEIDSPGEPGVSYIAGAGFYQLPAENSTLANVLQSYSRKAATRNIELINRINRHVPEIALNYNEVLPLTPSGNATERHIISAYIQKAEKIFFDKIALTKYWSDLLGINPEDTRTMMEPGFKLEEAVRSKFAKKGGYGYLQPSIDTFPPVEDFFAFVKSCGAIPMESWLDGTSDGEKDGKALLELSKSKGAAALNLIPDRNWNVSDNKVKAIKTENLKRIIETAVSMNMPIHIGTEMNKNGLPFADDLDGTDLKPYKRIFIEGACIVAGHTILGRFADFTYMGEKSENEFGSLKKRNAFFASVGALPAVNQKVANTLKEAGEEKSISIIFDSAKKGKWLID